MDNFNSLSLAEAAEEYAKMGLYVFPLIPGTKFPIGKGGFHMASNEIDQVRKWWKANPRYNIGIATEQSSLYVVDVDIKDGHRGPETLRRVEEYSGEPLPKTWTVKTGTGGAQYYFSRKKPIKSSRGENILDGLDTRADGGYTVAPPSIHPDTHNAYEWEAGPLDMKIAAAPYKFSDSYLDLLRQGKKKESATRDFSRPEAGERIQEGGRTSYLVSLIGEYSQRKLSKEEIRERIELANRTECEPPLSDEELKREVFPAIERYADNDAKEAARREAPKKVLLRPLDELEEKEAEWLIPGVMPKNQITIIAGEGGSGKTSLWCNIAAAISAGRPSILEPDELAPNRAPAKVVYFSGEDSTVYVLRRRLRKSGANMKMISTVDLGGEGLDALKFGSPQLEEILESTRPALCIFDPLQAFIPGELNMGYRNAMRAQLAPLIRYGELYGTTFLIVMHANKQSGVWGRKRMADSSDMWDIARSVLLVGETGENGERYISQEKCNYGPLQDTVIFKLQDGAPIFIGTSDKKDKDYIARAVLDKPSPTKEYAEELIMETLEQGEMQFGTLWALIKGQNIGKRTFDAVIRKLGKEKKIIRRNISGGRGKGVLWLIRRAEDPENYEETLSDE